MGKANRFLTCLLLLFAICGFSMPARAYLDPGTGTMLVQLLLGGVAGALVICKLYWHKLTAFLRRGASKNVNRNSASGGKLE